MISKTELTILVQGHYSIRAIAAKMNCSPSNVRYWLEKYSLKTNSSCKTQAIKICYIHDYPYNKKSYCSKCSSVSLSKRRRDRRQQLIHHYGGECKECGYSKYYGALHFHHIEPAKKEFPLSVRNCSKPFEDLIREAEKCRLLCANCHFIKEWYEVEFNYTNHARKRKEKRLLLIKEAGGKCQTCSIDNHSILQFHHLDPESKLFALDQKSMYKNIEKLRNETKKCQLLCANCHLEKEYRKF